MLQSFDPNKQFSEVHSPDHQGEALEADLRLPQWVGLKVRPGRRLSNRKIAVVGVGSVGRRIALHLARLGVAVLWLIDPDHYEDRANLVTQEILVSDLGRSKAESTANACKGISPTTRVFAHRGRFQDLDPVLIADADVVFLATDNLAVEVDVSRQCRLLGIQIIQAALHGETLVAQVRFVENRLSNQPCLICLHGPDETRHLNRSSVFACSGTTPGETRRERVHVLPTMSASFLCSLAADFATTQWVRHTLGLGIPVADTLLQYCGYTHRLTQADLKRNQNCRCDHLVLEQITLPECLEDYTIAELAEQAGLSPADLEGRSFTIGGSSFVEFAVCHCRRHRIERFVSAGALLARCSGCGTRITPEPFHTSRPTPGGALKPFAGRPLKDLGARRFQWAAIQDGERGILLRAADFPSDTHLPGDDS